MPNELAKAFVKAQKNFAPALKTSTNPHFKSKYVDLAGCVEAVIDALNSNGIALLQNTHESDNGVIVETVFLHESGETLSCGKLHVPAGKQDPQGYGSALTYARRYSLMAACGIAPEDDDGNAASKRVIAPVKAAMQSVKINGEDEESRFKETEAFDLLAWSEKIDAAPSKDVVQYIYLEAKKDAVRLNDAPALKTLGQHVKKLLETKFAEAK